jgi:hypothetical protein
VGGILSQGALAVGQMTIFLVLLVDKVIKMDSVIEARGNKLFVIDDWLTMAHQPIGYKIAWPTGLFKDDHPELIGKSCSHLSGSVKTEDGVVVKLEFGEHTSPSQEHSIERNVPRPSGRYTYLNGHWRKR